MCNLNVIIRKNTDNRDLTAFLMAVTSNSYSSNPDGDGIFCNDRNFKQPEKLNLLDFETDINKSKIILTHQRIATSGFEKEFIQPFMHEEFVLIHNGVINDFLGTKGSDTWGFFVSFLKKFKQTKGNREERIVRTIKNLLDKKPGSYSIAILDRKTQKVYYFKDTYPKINFYFSDEILYITTAETNKQFLTLLNEEFDEWDIKPHKIYRIDSKEITPTIVGKIKKNEVTYSYGGYGYNCRSQYFADELNEGNVKPKEPDPEPIIERDIIISDIPLPCDFCTIPTHNKVDGERICDECLEEQASEMADYNRGYV